MVQSMNGLFCFIGLERPSINDLTRTRLERSSVDDLTSPIGWYNPIFKILEICMRNEFTIN